MTATGQGQMPPIDSRLMTLTAHGGRNTATRIPRRAPDRAARLLPRDEPFRIEEEPTDQPEKLAARLRLLQPIPAEIPLIVGDILHNLRSALDSLVYELTTQAAGRPLTPRKSGPANSQSCPTRHRSMSSSRRRARPVAKSRPRTCGTSSGRYSPSFTLN